MIQTEPSTAAPPLPTTRPDVADPGYPRYVRRAPKGAFSAEALAADYRAACETGRTEARDAAASRLFAADADRDLDDGFLRVVRNEAKKIARVRRDLQPGDFVRMILDEIRETLPTNRGAHAEVGWDDFCFQRSKDVARRELAQKRLRNVHDPLPDGHARTGTAGPDPEVVEALWATVESAADEIPDPALRLVARDQFGPHPSKKSGDRWRHPVTGKPSLLVQLDWEQTRENRDRVYTLIKRARAVIRAELLKAIESGELPVDASFLRDWRLDPDS